MTRGRDLWGSISSRNNLRRRNGRSCILWIRPLERPPKRRLYVSTFLRISATSGSRCCLNEASPGTNKVIWRRHSGHLHGWIAEPWCQTSIIQLPQNQWEQLAWQGILKLLRHTEQQSFAKGSSISLSLSLSRWAFFKTIYLGDKFWIAPDQKWNSRLRVPWIRIPVR